MSELDDPRRYEQFDCSDMAHLLAELPAQARRAWAEAQSWEIPPSLTRPRRVVVTGVGGSAIGGDVVAEVAATRTEVPVQVLRRREPPLSDEHTLVVACSFSGSTEEALAALNSAAEAGSMCIAVTTGGPLAEAAEAQELPLFRYSCDGPPRTAFGYGALPLLAFLQRLGVLDMGATEIESTFAALTRAGQAWGVDAPLSTNRAKQLACRIDGRAPVVIGVDFLAVAARRWAAQTNENAKQWAFHLELPEIDHNLIEGLRQPIALRDSIHAILLDSPAIEPRSRMRVQSTAELLREAGVETDNVVVEHDGVLESVMCASYLGDWVSYYIAMLNGIDPTPVPVLSGLKASFSP
ncbi:MAG: bifunctional phosphoglucose/phosphomannose isomerase [Dehalococcoidia bacterium]|nr:bifunctional phosphoglucose/phosphomannose isomerase [Dehalococcoidia bacterium]